MLNGNTAFNLDPQPLPDAASQAAFESVIKRGFPQEGFLRKYSFSSPNIERPVIINALAFAHAIHRNPGEYAGITVFNATDSYYGEISELVSALAESSAPFHLIHLNDQFSFWASTLNNGRINPIHVQSQISYEQLDNVLSDYAVDLKPKRIIDVKQGRDTFTLPIFRDMHSLQLSLWVAEVTGDLLVDHFALAVEELRKFTRNRRDTRAYDASVTSIAIQLLGAVILADSGVFGDELRLYDVTLSKLIREAQRKFPNYFQEHLFNQYYEAAEKAYEVLRLIRYSGFVPDMLSRIYTAAYSKEQRKKLGRFDTPLYLTRRIWENIPVEFLPPNKRFVVDMTCGWGSFLISGHERLSSLSDTPTSLRRYIRGNDINLFTARLAGLGLLLSTSEDSWYIDHENAPEWSWLENHQPNIIVGNPPFGGNRKSLTDKETRYQEADKFLERAISSLAPNGYLAMLMPSSFIGAEASPELRKLLLENCDVLELWELPTEVFPPDVAVQTVVVFAQKKGEDEPRKPSVHPVRVRTVQSNTLKSLKHSAIFTASGLVANQSIWNEEARKSEGSKNTHIMDFRITLPEYMWSEIESHSVRLNTLAEVFLGVIEGKKPENKGWKDFPHPRQVHLLTGVKDVIKRPFFIDYEKARTIIYPNDLEKPRKDLKHPEKDKEKYLEGAKVLLASDPHPTWGRVVKVAIERRNHFVSNSFWVIVPNTYAQSIHITHEVLAAILSWHVCNAWFVNYLKYPWIPERAINEVPIPSQLSIEDCIALTEAVWKIEAAYSDQQIPLEATQTIDTILKAAYHLDEATFERLRKITEWKTESEVTLDIQPNRDQANCFISGVVEMVESEAGFVELGIKGFEGFQTVQIVPSMPGWMLRPGAAFYTKIPRSFVKQGHINFDTIDWDTFRPQTYTYMNEAELMEGFANLSR